MTNTLPSNEYSAAIEKCSKLLLSISTMNESINQLISRLNQAIKDAKTLNRNVLIAKTTGVSAGAAGAVMYIVGLCLIPVTAGLSVPILCGFGTAISVSGAATNIGTSIAEVSLQKSHNENITNIKNVLCSFERSYELYYGEIQELEETLRNCDLSELRYLGNFFQKKRLLNVIQWLKAGHFHKDDHVSHNYLRKGDHILRRIRSSPLHAHHGIYINKEMVVEFTQKGVISRTLKVFAEGQPLKRRQYNGCDLPAIETEQLAMEALKESSSCYPYHLLKNNCEHFATMLKLRFQWSSQADNALKTTMEVCKNVPRPLSLIVEGVESGAQIAAALAPKASSIFSIFNKVSSPVMSNLSKVAIVLAPIAVAADITFLVFDYKKENVAVDNCDKAIRRLEEMKSSLQEHSKELQRRKTLLIERRCNAELFEQEAKRLEAQRIEEAKRLEAQRIEDERIEKRWRESMEIRCISFCFLHFLQIYWFS